MTGVKYRQYTAVLTNAVQQLDDRTLQLQNTTATRSRHVQINAATETVTVNDTLQLEASQLGTCSGDVAGTMQRNATDNELYYCDGEAWEQLSPS